MWGVSRLDIESTLRDVCTKVLGDHSVSLEERRLRAVALRELGRVFKLVVKRERAREELVEGAAGAEESEGGDGGAAGAAGSRGKKKPKKSARKQMEEALRGMAEQHQER
jgi:hypothetical protein